MLKLSIQSELNHSIAPKKFPHKICKDTNKKKYSLKNVVG